MKGYLLIGVGCIGVLTTEGVWGIRGICCGSVSRVLATEGIEILALGVVATWPGGAGSFVAGLADPGRTMGLESEILGLPFA